MWPFFCSHFLNGNNTSRTLSLFTSLSFISFDISKVYIMSSPTSLSSPALHSFFNKEKTSAETTTKLDIISFIRDDDHIQRLDEKNWQCLWCNQTFQVMDALIFSG